jgi:hypothetical protein
MSIEYVDLDLLVAERLAPKPSLLPADAATTKALDPSLLEQRDFIYEEHWERPLSW